MGLSLVCGEAFVMAIPSQGFSEFGLGDLECCEAIVMGLPLPTCVDFTREIEDCRISVLEIVDDSKAGKKTSVTRNLRIHLFGIQLSVWSVSCFMSNVKRCMFVVERWL